MGKALLMRFARQSALRSPVFFGAKTTANSMRNSIYKMESPVSNAVCKAKCAAFTSVFWREDDCKQHAKQHPQIENPASGRPRARPMRRLSTVVAPSNFAESNFASAAGAVCLDGGKHCGNKNVATMWASWFSEPIRVGKFL